MRNFTDVFIHRPVFAIVLSLLIFIVGLRAYNEMPVRQFPSIEASVITIQTTYPGASPELMESFVSTPIENALAGVEGIDFMTSSNSQGSTNVTIHFVLGYDINKAIADITHQVSSVRGKLPKEINDPIITKQDPNANPTMYLAFVSQKMPQEAISDYALRVVQPQLATLPGVGQTVIYGSPYAMRIWLDPQRMAAFNVTASDIQQALEKNNVQSAPGRIKGPQQESDIVANTDLQTAAQFNNLVIEDQRSYLVRLKDVGNAELGTSNNRITAVFNGEKTVVMAVIPQSTANPLQVSKAVNRVLPRIQHDMPSGLKAVVIYDASQFVAKSLNEVFRTILEATAFVVIVIFFSLGSARAVLIPLVTIPFSLVGVCGLMLAMGYSLNTFTLLAWVLAIGLVVDDAIVVLENIHRHIEAGMQRKEAALLGAREIGFAVIAMTLTLAAVYAPIGFVSGLIGILFREFAFTLASAVIISGFIALTLSPMMCSKILTHSTPEHPLSKKIDRFFNALMMGYQTLLRKVVDRKKIVMTIAGGIYLAGYILYATLPSELAPQEDQGYLYSIVLGPTSANLAYTEKYTKEVERIYKQVPEMSGYGIINGIPSGVNTAIAFLVFKSWDERKRTVNEILGSILPPLLSIPGVIAFPINPPPLPTSEESNPVSLVLKTTQSYSEINNAMQKLLGLARANPMLLNLNTELKMDKAQTSIVINRNKAADLGIAMEDISNSLNLLLGEPSTSRFVMEGRSYDVIPALYPQFMDNPNKLDNIQIRSHNGALVPLSSVVTIRETIAPQTLEHFQQQRAAVLTASLAPGYTIGQALDYLTKLAKQHLSEDFQLDYSGQSRQFIESSGALAITFFFAVLFIFLILSAQFESFLSALIIIITVPLSLAGALLVMHIIGATKNIYTQIGLITLIGLITKHGILIVEFANQLREKGKTLHDAIIESATIRLRPILMTTATMVLGTFPLALATGAGAVSRSQIGWVVVGGMLFGTFFTLFILPSTYIVVATLKEKVRSLITNTRTSSFE